MVKSLNTKMDMSCKGTWYRNGPFRFSARNSRQTLRAIKARIPRESLRKAPSMGFILKHRFKNLGKMILKKKA